MLSSVDRIQICYHQQIAQICYHQQIAHKYAIISIQNTDMLSSVDSTQICFHQQIAHKYAIMSRQHTNMLSSVDNIQISYHQQIAHNIRYHQQIVDNYAIINRQQTDMLSSIDSTQICYHQYIAHRYAIISRQHIKNFPSAIMFCYTMYTGTIFGKCHYMLCIVFSRTPEYRQEHTQHLFPQ